MRVLLTAGRVMRRHRRQPRRPCACAGRPEKVTIELGPRTQNGAPIPEERRPVTITDYGAAGLEVPCLAPGRPRGSNGGGGAGTSGVNARNVRATPVLELLVTPRLAALLLVLAAGTVSAQEQFYYLGNPEEDAPQAYPTDEPSDQTPQPDEYEGALQPYGTWQDAPTYGRFWRPSVAAGWQPYVDGRWGWTPHGWTWLSSEPWNWTFHYGRWSFLPTWGWAWFPGSVWGPAWVRWVWFGDFIGWAPLSSFGGPVFNQFVFVRGRDFCSPRLRRFVVQRDFVPRGIRTHWRDHIDRVPDRRWVERESGHTVRVVTDRPTHMLPPWQRRRAQR